jgi:hypothetical protein
MASESCSEAVSRGAGCGKSARPDLWGARPGNRLGLPDYLRRLDDWQIEVLSESIEDPEMRITVGLSLLSPDCSPDRLRSVQMTIDQLPRDAHRVHWKLLWIASGCSGLTRAEIGEELIDLSSCMRELGHGVELVEIQRFLELIADFLPERLAEETEQAIWAPQTGPELLFELAEDTRSEALLNHLLENQITMLLFSLRGSLKDSSPGVSFCKSSYRACVSLKGTSLL